MPSMHQMKLVIFIHIIARTFKCSDEYE